MAKQSRKFFISLGLVFVTILGGVCLVRPTHKASLTFLAGSPTLWQEASLTGRSARPNHAPNQFWPDSIATWSAGKRNIPKPPIVNTRLGGNMTVRHAMYRFKGGEDEIMNAIHALDPKVQGWLSSDYGAHSGYKMVTLNLGQKRDLTLQWCPSEEPGCIDIIVDESAPTTQEDRIEAFLRGGYFHPSHELP